MNTTEVPSGSAKKTKQKITSNVQFIKIDDGHILARVTRGETVVEAVISTVPSESSEGEETEIEAVCSAQDMP
jgi:hypothetical protein